MGRPPYRGGHPRPCHLQGRPYVAGSPTRAVRVVACKGDHSQERSPAGAIPVEAVSMGQRLPKGSGGNPSAGATASGT
ncbi:hypothetical protein B296_00057116 [Ensete ventricosum]|uniref:Uncharacterized protein n=1 Tax=Ensete ventricosum TaxID=4639 RepID=A0A426X7Z4_ENSVE|nr:hypothetical protein B296_00057116 [Ensete ventricosum]